MLLKAVITAATTLLTLFVLTACSSSTPGAESSPSEQRSASPRPSTPPSPPATSGTGSGTDAIVGTVLRFSSAAASVDVTVDQDNPAVRDLLSKLPLRLTLEEFAGREKVSYLPEGLEHGGSPGSDPEDGDLIYFVPWGNLGFYYNAEGIGYSDQTIHIGRYESSLDELRQLEGAEVAVEVVDRG
jgi:hypothetical protein